MESNLWCVWIEDETGLQECVAEGFESQTEAQRYADQIEACDSFWAEVRRQK